MSIIHTFDLMFYKENSSREKIGSHMLVAVFFQKGVVIGKYFDDRRHQSLEWIHMVHEDLIIAGWGDRTDFVQLKNFLGNHIRSLSELLGDNPNYQTSKFLTEVLSRHMRKTFAEDLPLAVDSLLIHPKKQTMELVYFDGDSRFLKQFAVLGGYPYPIGEIQSIPVKIDTKEEGDATVLEKMIIAHMSAPAKEALRWMGEKFKGLECLPTQVAAIKMVSEVLRRFDPPSKTELFEIIVLEGEKGTSTIVKRNPSEKK